MCNGRHLDKAHMCMYIHIYKHTYTYICVCIYVCVCVCVCVCIFPLPVEIHQVSLDINLEFITLWVKAPGKINMQKAEGESSVLLSFLCFTFRFINSSRNTFYPYKICCPRGFFFFFPERKGKQISQTVSGGDD